MLLTCSRGGGGAGEVGGDENGLFNEGAERREVDEAARLLLL